MREGVGEWASHPTVVEKQRVHRTQHENPLETETWNVISWTNKGQEVKNNRTDVISFSRIRQERKGKAEVDNDMLVSTGAPFEGKNIPEWVCWYIEKKNASAKRF